VWIAQLRNGGGGVWEARHVLSREVGAISGERGGRRGIILMAPIANLRNRTTFDHCSRW